MSNKKLYILWGALAVLCIAMSFIEEVDSGLAALMFLLAAAFFVPPAMLLYRGIKKKDAFTVGVIRWTSLVSLALTFLLLLLNFLSVGASRLTGDVLYVLLTLVSVPMVCSQFWALSMFVWACMMILGFKYRKMK